MTRISLKEQYDNSSVVKQISDLTTEIEGYEEKIETISETADTAKSTADAATVAAQKAQSVADSAVSHNSEQDSRLDSIEATDTAQEQEIAGIKLKDAQQDTSIAELAQEQDEQDAKIAAIQSKDSEQDAKISLIQAKDAEQDLSISSILDTDTKQDAAIDGLKTIANTLTNEVISAVNVTDGTQNGSIMVKLANSGGAVISSPSYPWGQVATFALKQGSEAGYVRGVLTLSDGEVIESNDYQILQVQESDVYVTSITLTPYPTTGKMGGEIGYSNGNVAQINVIDVPTAPGVTSNINDLLSRMGVVETSVNDLDVRVQAIEETPGVGAFSNLSRGAILGSAEDGKVSANDDGTGSVSGWSDVVKSAQISDMLTQTAAASTYLTKTDAAAAYETLEGAEQINVVANEAKSTAEDAQTKANGCFNTVAVNTAGDGLTFSTPSGATTDVAIPTPTISPLMVTSTSIECKTEKTPTVTNAIVRGAWFGNADSRMVVSAVALDTRVNSVWIRESLPIFFTTLEAQVFAVLSGTVYTNTFKTSDIDSAIRDKIIDLALPDGVYWVRVEPLAHKFTADYNISLNYEITDGDVTLTSTESTKSLNFVSEVSGSHFFIRSIMKIVV